MNNTLIIQTFDRLKNLRAMQAEELTTSGKIKDGEKISWKVKAYINAIEAIKYLNSTGKYINSIEDVKGVRGIGKSLTLKIGEIIKTGTVAELTAATSEKETVIKLFSAVNCVGMVTAFKWYEAGYRQLADIPPAECTTAQQIAIQYHSELLQRIPRSEIDEFVRRLEDHLEGSGIIFEVCGSYRRGRMDSGDIDVLVISRDDKNVLQEILSAPIFTHTLMQGPKKYLGIGKINQLHRRIDIEVVKPEEYPFAVVYFTGPASFNVKMRDYCSKFGFRLNEKYLVDINGNKYQAIDEPHLFEMLQLQYLTPAEREAF